jgi:hypothetical protein
MAECMVPDDCQIAVLHIQFFKIHAEV